jgi:hypothetical protein
MPLVPITDPEDMDSGAIARRAAARGERAETYDPDRLIGEVMDLLRHRGLHPALPPGTGRLAMATGASGKLLRAFGIVPAGDFTVIDRLDAPDPESR